MTEFDVDRLGTDPDSVFEAAMLAPVTLTRDGKPYLVVLSKERYEDLVANAGRPVRTAREVLDVGSTEVVDGASDGSIVGRHLR